MARLHSNAWIYGYSNDNLSRNNGGNTIIALTLSQQSQHEIFSIYNGNAIQWNGNVYPGYGRYQLMAMTDNQDGDDNEEGWGGLAFDFGVKTATTQDYSAKLFSMKWSTLNTAYPDMPVLVSGVFPNALVGDAADQVCSIYWNSRQFWNGDKNNDPGIYWSLQSMGQQHG